MRENSHLDDMRAALRGDFERLAERRGAQGLMQAPSGEPEWQPAEDVAEPEEPVARSRLSRIGRWLATSGVERGPPTDGAL